MYRLHPVSNHFPPIGEADYRKLRNQIRREGQKRPIALYEGMIWDGRSRLQACQELGLQPKVRVLKPKDQPVAYLLKRHNRYGEPLSPERSAALDILWRTDQADCIAAYKQRRTEWLRLARNEFKSYVFKDIQPCDVCSKHAEFTHAHHLLPLGLQFDLGLEEATHEFTWLCPTHHRYVHMLISVYMTATREGWFLDHIPDHAIDEWNEVERVFHKSFELFKSDGGMNHNGLGYDYDYC